MYSLIFASSGIESDFKIWQPTKDREEITGEEDWEENIRANSARSGQTRSFILSPNLLFNYLLRNRDLTESDEDGEQPRQRRRMAEDGGEEEERRTRLAAAVAQLLTNADWVEEDDNEEEQDSNQEEGEERGERGRECHMM